MKRLKPDRKFHDFQRFNTYLVFKLRSGDVVASLEHEEPIEDSLRRVTVQINGRPHYVLTYPKHLVNGSVEWGTPKDMDVSGCIPLECVIPVDDVKQVWTQRRGQM